MFKNIGIVGLGLIGGSLAKAVKENLNAFVYAYDHNNNSLAMAKAEGVIDGELDNSVLPKCDRFTERSGLRIELVSCGWVDLQPVGLSGPFHLQGDLGSVGIVGYDILGEQDLAFEGIGCRTSKDPMPSRHTVTGVTGD